ncbi:MAG: hypothetical protein K1X67_02480 [Fimbriimonadaceae bacterium]|nr:hypothetical protein [Fimbriimonadaceae bacterium]
MVLTSLVLALVAQPPYIIHADGIPEPTRQRVERSLTRGTALVENAMGAPFPHRFPVELAAHRRDFDRVTAAYWKMPPSEKWMVGAGASNVLILLSPDAWRKEAVEHDASSEKELDQIIAHELTHVYHGQVCPRRDFDGMDDMGWFVEGLAVVVSGQLEMKYLGVARRAVESGRGPQSLAAAWSGPHRYGVAGSMVKYLGEKWGRLVRDKAMRCTSTAQVLRLLGVSEAEFLAGWRGWLKEKS